MGHNTIIEFLKAQMSSLVSTACDFCTTAVVFEITRHVVASTFSGSIIGGLVNCSINYGWTFKGTPRNRTSVFWRYMLVWLGSIILNTTGTEYGVKFIDLWVDTNLSVVMVARVIVAVLVGIFWNFTMQKYFVYKK